MVTNNRGVGQRRGFSSAETTPRSRFKNPVVAGWNRLLPNSLLLITTLATSLCVLAATHLRFPGDATLLALPQAIDNAAWHLMMLVVTEIGGGWVAMVMLAVLAPVLLLHRRYPEGLSFLGVFSLNALVPVLKGIINRPRPSGQIVDVLTHHGGSSFPSGHSILAMVFFGLLFYMIPHLTQDRRTIGVIRSVSLIIILLTGLSRVYLGVHWPSDVIGAYVIGGVVLMLLIAFHQWARQGAEAELTAY
jgi:undecaprenyl-diphosphatase